MIKMTILLVVIMGIAGFIFFNLYNKNHMSIQSKRTAPLKVLPIVFENSIILTVPTGKMGVIVASDFFTGDKKWETKVYDVIYNPSLEQDAQDDFITDILVDDKVVVVVTETGRQFILDPQTGKVVGEKKDEIPPDILSARRTAIMLAHGELLKRYPNGLRNGQMLQLVYVVPAKATDSWIIKFDLGKGITDSSVEITVDIKTRKILNVKSVWS